MSNMPNIQQFYIAFDHFLKYEDKFNKSVHIYVI